MPSPVSVLVLSEDVGEQIHPALEALLKKMFRLVDERCGTNRIDFLPADGEARKALRGKAHAAANPSGHQHRRFIAARIAAQLKRDDSDGFVAYHQDADKTWSKRSSDTSDDFPAFTSLRAVVRELLKQPRRPGAAMVDHGHRIDRLLLLAPYWELEAWLYQNLAVATRLCQEHDGGRHLELFQQWAASRGSLDDVRDTKDACCLGDRHNQKLAESAYPAREVHEAGASFSDTVMRLRDCRPLREALARTRWDGAED